MTQEPTEIFHLENNGFDILHYPKDSEPCLLKDGVCNNIKHLHAISQSHRDNPGGIAAVIAAIDRNDAVSGEGPVANSPRAERPRIEGGGKEQR